MHPLFEAVVPPQLMITYIELTSLLTFYFQVILNTFIPYQKMVKLVIGLGIFQYRLIWWKRNYIGNLIYVRVMLHFAISISMKETANYFICNACLKQQYLGA